MTKPVIEITKAPIVHEPIILTRENDVEKFKMKFEEVLDPYPDRWKLNYFEKMSVWISKGAKYAELIYIIITFITKIGGKMEDKKVISNDKKTTYAGIIQVVVATISGIVALIWGKEIPADIQTALVSLAGIIFTVAGFFGSWFTNKPDQIDGK